MPEIMGDATGMFVARTLQKGVRRYLANLREEVYVMPSSVSNHARYIKAWSVSGILASILIFTASSAAFAGVVIRDVTLQNTFLDGSALSAEIFGEMTDSCKDGDNFQISLAPSLMSSKEINVYIEGTRDENHALCSESPVSFYKEVELGTLEPGFYTINIFENANQIYSKGVLIPLDVKTAPLGIDRYRILGEN